MKKPVLITAALIALFVVPVFAAPPGTGCNKIKFWGSYTRPTLNVDVFGDGTAYHSFLFQLTLNSDGTATQTWTGATDYLMNAGTGTPWIGSWTCRQDGKLVVTMITASFFPVGPNPNPPIINADLELSGHTRLTYLFSVDDENTLTRLQARSRNYGPNADPTDPNGGTLRPLTVTTATYKRLVATDADLLAP